MSNHWKFFPCQMDEHLAFIFYDHGIHDNIDAVIPPHLLKVRVAFKQAHPDGMPANEEFESLTALEDALLALVQQHDSLYVGRVTVDGHRHFYIYTPHPEQSWLARLRAFGASHNYAVSCAFQSDDNCEGYWNDLFPSEDDWQVIKDSEVMDALRKEGDDGIASRRIDHWAYFPSHDAAEQFSGWAERNGYTLGQRDVANDGSYCVRMSHTGTVQLVDITSHTITLRRTASELGGNYDGWETVVCKPSG